MAPERTRGLSRLSRFGAGELIGQWLGVTKSESYDRLMGTTKGGSVVLSSRIFVIDWLLVGICQYELLCFCFGFQTSRCGRFADEKALRPAIVRSI